MSDHIAHLAICDDTFRLALLHPQIHADFKKIMTQQRDIAHMGAITRSADKWSADLIVWARQQKHRDAPDPQTAQKLAFVLGALTHRSADRLTKPITNCWGKDVNSHEADSGAGSANESKIVQDIFIFKEVYGSGAGENADPFTRAVLQTPTESEAHLEEYFRVLWRRALIAMHTIAPDGDNIQPWLTAFLNGLQTFPKSLSQYAELAANWDSETVRKYLIDKNFYRRDDVLIRLAREVQRGSTVTAQNVVDGMVATDKTHSRYARALAKALDYLLAASELYAGEIDLDAGKERFDIGVPELSLQE